MAPPGTPTRISLDVDSRTWRLSAMVLNICLAVTLVGVAIAGWVTYDLATGFAFAVVFLPVLSPLLWSARFASRAARSHAWLDVDSAGLVLHHPVFLKRDLAIDREIINSYFVGELPGAPPASPSNDSDATAWKRLGAWSRSIDGRIGWRPPAGPSLAAPDLATVGQARGWNFVLVLQESTFLGHQPRRRLMLSSRLGPRRNSWIRGLFGAVTSPDAAETALTNAGIGRTELTPEVLAWLADGPPVPLGRALRNYRRDHGRGAR